MSKNEVISSEWAEYLAKVDSGDILEPEDTVVNRLKKYEFSIDNALDNMDLTFGGYQPSRDALEFFSLMRVVLGEDFEVENSLMHYFLIDLIFGNIERHQYPYSKKIQDKIRINPRKIAIMTSRGLAKSTVVTAFLPIYLAIKGKMPNFGNLMFVVGFGDSQQAGAKVQANTIRDICEDSQFCNEYFEKMRFTDEECEFTRRGTGTIKSRSFMYKVKGAAGGSVRGIRYKTVRPDMIIFDDIIKSEADANSKVIMKKLRSMMYADAENALSAKKGKIIAINTPFNKNDPVYQALESGTWTPVCIPMCERIDEHITKEQFIGAWEPMHSYERISERYLDAVGTNTLREFMQELMLRISSEEDKLIPDHLLQWFSAEHIIQNAWKYNWYLTTDYTSTGSKGSDLSGAALFAVGWNQDIFLVGITLRKFELEEQYNETFNMIEMIQDKVRWVEAGVETDGQQNIHIYSLKKKMPERNTYFSFARQKNAKIGVEGIRSRLEGGNKHWRFRQMLPSFQNKKIWFADHLKGSEDMNELLEEIKYTTYSSFNSKYDDGADLLSMMNAIDIQYPSKEYAGQEKPKKTGRKNTSLNAKIWGKRQSSEEEYEGPRSSYV